MNDFDKLLSISTKEISQRTHILETVIDNIKSKNFSAIKVKTHFNGFISSISSEYDLDIQELINEYDIFYGRKDTSITNEVKEKKQKINHKSNKVEEKQKDTKEKKVENNNTPKSGGGSNILIIIIILSLSIALFFYITKDNKGNKANNNTNTTKKELKKNIQKVNNTIKIKATKKVLPKTITTVPKKKKYTFSTKNKKKLLAIQGDRLYVEPFRNNKLWIGIIDLNNKKQVGEVLKGLTSYNLKSNSIVLTGHGYLKVSSGEEKKSYKTLKKLYFYYKNGTLYKISEKDVIALNGGFLW